MPKLNLPPTTPETPKEKKPASKPASKPAGKKSNGNGKPSPRPSAKGSKRVSPSPIPVALQPVPVDLPVIYPEIDVRLFTGDNRFTAEIAKELIGWEEEPKPGVFLSSYLLTDRNGAKVRCLNNVRNRPFYPKLAEDWMLEILRRKWRFNFETIKVDQYGLIHDGQHRIVGLIWAVQEWHADKKRPVPEQRWQDFWKEEPWIETLVGLGMDGDDDTVNTIGTGKPRTLTDILYRCRWFAEKPEKIRESLARITATAVKVVWTRTAQHLSSWAPRRPHSESLDFIARHERILECVKFIHEEGSPDGEDKKLQPFVQLGYAAGLLYLMGSAASDSDVYDKVNAESALDWKLWDRACEFWVDVASNGKVTEALRERLLRIPADIAGGYELDLRCGLIIKAWNLFSDRKKITEEAIDIETGLDSDQRPILAETPRLGGIDVYTTKTE